uniref:Uncharacterized protein n=1 Tax=Rhizophora mucronata TaxID=61149 RepID=A0A2P2IZF6_RHIMU
MPVMRSPQRQSLSMIELFGLGT